MAGGHPLRCPRSCDAAPARPARARRAARCRGGAVRLLTLAPELEGAAAVIAVAVARGIVVSVGHTDATYAQARAAFDAGARHLTHLGNAMRGIDRREPGPIAAALADERVTVEVIADGHHVHPALLRLAARAAPGRLVAITDAISATGLPDGEHRLGELAVRVHDGRAVLADQAGDAGRQRPDDGPRGSHAGRRRGGADRGDPRRHRHAGARARRRAVPGRAGAGGAGRPRRFGRSAMRRGPPWSAAGSCTIRAGCWVRPAECQFGLARNCSNAASAAGVPCRPTPIRKCSRGTSPSADA